MLTIGKLGAGQEAYYLEKAADGAEDYYSGEGEAPGRWTGEGSSRSRGARTALIVESNRAGAHCRDSRVADRGTTFVDRPLRGGV
jgi:hypothetical protein